MTELFLKVVNMSISASWLVSVVLVLRLVLKRMPKWVNVLLWGIVFIRLICPFSMESVLSLIPSADTIPYDIALNTTPTINTGISVINDTVNPIISESNKTEPGASVNPLQITLAIVANLWVIGMGIMIIYMIISYVRLYRNVGTAISLRENIFQSENITSPFVLGVVKPKIYIPFEICEFDMEYVIAHEKAHIGRRDHWWKILSYFMLVIHWFNPFVWISYIVLCRDIELACDEKVIKKLGNEQRADYSKALLACSVGYKKIVSCPLAFGEIGVKKRIKTVLHYKKPTFWVVVMSVVVCGIVAICFLTNPKQEKMENNNGISKEANNTTGTSISEVKEESFVDQDSENENLNGMAYYIELSAKDTEFQDMDEKQKQEILTEYEDLLKDYSLKARESTNGATSYILGTYNGNVENSPLFPLGSMEYYGPETNGKDTQVLYKDSDWDGYTIYNSFIHYSDDKSIIMIQPNDSELSFRQIFNKCLTPNGREYVEDAFARGIVIGNCKEPYLEVHLVTELHGEEVEIIPLTKAEAMSIMKEKSQPLEEGVGFIASLTMNGETVNYSAQAGVPKTVLNLVTEKCGYKFETPDSIDSSIVEARLDCDWWKTPLYAKESDLERLKEILTNAKFEGNGACGCGAKITLRLSNGKKMMVYKSSDGCDSVVFNSYSGYSLGEKENEEFWRIFGLDVDKRDSIK